MPRQLVACEMDGQVGVESTGVCGPVRVEAGDWHTAHAARGLNADDLTVVLTLVHLLGNEEGHNNVTRREHTLTPAFVACRSWWPTAVCESITIGEHLVEEDLSFLQLLLILNYCLLWV